MGGMGRVFDIAELGGIVKFQLYQTKQAFCTPTPTQLKKYATGKGGGPNAGKDQVCLHVFKNWGFEPIDNNEGDAYTLSRIALALSGFDTALKAYQKEVIEQIQNPPVKKGKKNEREKV
jgi:crossover junction endodeoxyribonuclease RuvC